MKDDQVFYYVIRVPKEHSAFTYFQLEASEGLSFYSTLEESLGQGYRDIEIQGHVSLKEELDQVLTTLSTKFPLEYIKQA